MHCNKQSKAMAGSKKAVRAALRASKREKLAADGDVVEQQVDDVEEEEGTPLCPARLVRNRLASIGGADAVDAAPDAAYSPAVSRMLMHVLHTSAQCRCAHAATCQNIQFKIHSHTRLVCIVVNRSLARRGGGRGGQDRDGHGSVPGQRRVRPRAL